jgi:streptogramin lyase
MAPVSGFSGRFHSRCNRARWGLSLLATFGLGACSLPASHFTPLERRDVATTGVLAIAIQQSKPHSKYRPQFISELDWESATATLTNAAPVVNTSQTSAVTVGAGATRSAALVFPGVTPATGYTLAIVLKRRNPAGVLVTVASGSVGLAIQPGPNNINVPVTLDPVNGTVSVAIPEPSLNSAPIISSYAGGGPGGAPGCDVCAATGAHVDTPDGVAYDPAGNIFVTDQNANRVRKIDPSGVITTVAGTGIAGSTGDGGQGTAAQLNLPSGVSLDSSQHLFIAEQGGNRVRRLDLQTGIIITVAGTGVAGSAGDGGAATSAQLNQPEGVVVDNSDDVFIADTANATIRKLSVGTGKISRYAGTGTPGGTGNGGPAVNANVSDTSGVGVNSTGDIFIADYVGHVIWRVDQSDFSIHIIAGTGGSGSTGDGGLATAAMLIAPEGVTADAAGNVYISDYVANVIRKVDKFGIISTYAGNGTAGFTGDGGPASLAEINAPEGMTFDVAGNGYIADGSNGLIRQVGTAPWLLSTAPSHAANGVTVTIRGAGFSTTPSNNSVVFNGTPAIVTAATVSQLTVKVPIGATTGKLSITVAGSTSNTRNFAVP